MSRSKSRALAPSKKAISYSRFNKIDGKHPLQTQVPDSFITYRVRQRHGGKIAFFNFELAKNMGLIPKDHPEQMNLLLTDKLLETFSLLIINEWDELNNTKISPEDIKKNKYMATRYLQMQHPNKQGKTSGDGRSIWNGQVRHQGKVWDLSSCGTGATCLSPATHIQQKYFQSGDPSISYGCGFAEVDEGMASLFFSEVFKKNNLETEQVLLVIEFPGRISINVRACSNLIRPSHFFGHLKQGNRDILEKMLEYYISQEEAAGRYDELPTQKSKRYQYFLTEFSKTFSYTAAKFEDEYIFCWMDWDGDNILMNGGIIDYGSVRQFGMFHHEYRFDDVDRFSTSIIEQKKKAKYTVQCFAQIVDFILKGKKKPINSYSRHKSLKQFEENFENCKKRNLLAKVGIAQKFHKALIKEAKKELRDFSIAFSYFERSKSKRGEVKVADGINWSAIFCMRDVLRELPQILASRDKQYLSTEEFLEVIKSTYATPDDLELTPYGKKMVVVFQRSYLKILEKLSKIKSENFIETLLEIGLRSSIINRYDRVTGDSITNIVEKVLNAKPRLMPEEVFHLMQEFRDNQCFDPDIKREKLIKSSRQTRIIRGMLKIVKDYREGL